MTGRVTVIEVTMTDAGMSDMMTGVGMTDMMTGVVMTTGVMMTEAAMMTEGAMKTGEVMTGVMTSMMIATTTGEGLTAGTEAPVEVAACDHLRIPCPN